MSVVTADGADDDSRRHAGHRNDCERDDGKLVRCRGRGGTRGL